MLVYGGVRDIKRDSQAVSLQAELRSAIGACDLFDVAMC